MSADRYEITDNNASIRCQKPGKGPLILYACDRDSSTQKIIAVIRQLRADLAAVSAERDLLAREISEADDLARHFVRDRPTLRARGAIVLQADEIGKLRAQLAEYENAPVVAITGALGGIGYTSADKIPPIGTELIARKVKK